MQIILSHMNYQEPLQVHIKVFLSSIMIQLRNKTYYQVGLDNRDPAQLWDSILRFFPKEELPKILQHAALTREQCGRFLVLELVIHKMR